MMETSNKSQGTHQDIEERITTFVENEFPAAIGIMLVGSAASSHLRHDSDYDFSVIHDSYRSIITKSTLLNEGCYKRIKTVKDFDIVAIKKEIEGRKVGIQVISQTAFDRICHFDTGHLTVYRPNPWDEYDHSKSAVGREIAVRPRADALPIGGYRLFLPILIDFNQEIFTGVHVHMYLTNPRFIRDIGGHLHKGIDLLWNNYLALLRRKLNKPDGPLLRDVLLSLWKSERFNYETIEFIRLQIKDTSKLRRDVSILLEDQMGRLILQKRENREGIRFPSYWGLFGGEIEVGETPESAARREILEELCLELDELIFQNVYMFRSGKIDFLYKAAQPVDPAKLVLREGEAIEVYPREAILKIKRLVPFDRRMLQDYFNSKDHY